MAINKLSLHMHIDDVVHHNPICVRYTFKNAPFRIKFLVLMSKGAQIWNFCTQLIISRPYICKLLVFYVLNIYV